MQGTDLLEHLRFSLYESTQGKYKSVGEHLKNAKSIRDATRILVSEYERPADIPGNIRSRGDTAENWFKADLGRRPSASGWGARMEPTGEPSQAEESARSSQAGASSGNNISNSNNITVNISGIPEPENVSIAVKDALKDAAWQMLPRQDTMR